MIRKFPLALPTSFALPVILTLGACSGPNDPEAAARGSETALSPEKTKALAQCGDGAQQLGRVSFATDVQPILDMNCVACHQAAAPEHDLVLETGLSYQSMVGRTAVEVKMPVVLAGNPQQSYLYHKIAGTHLGVGGKGARMPLGGQLDVNSIQKICSWIAIGAAKD